MSEIICQIGRLSGGEYWVEDVLAGVQVGWVNQSDDDKKWYILDCSYSRKAGPFNTLAEAKASVEDALRAEFGVGSPAI